MGFRKKILLFTIFLLVLSFLNVLNSTLFASIILDDSVGSLQIGKQIYYLEDPDNSFTFENIISGEQANKFIRSTDDIPNFGFTKSVYWVHFSILYKPGENSKKHEWFLHVSYLPF